MCEREGCGWLGDWPQVWPAADLCNLRNPPTSPESLVRVRPWEIQRRSNQPRVDDVLLLITSKPWLILSCFLFIVCMWEIQNRQSTNNQTSMSEFSWFLVFMWDDHWDYVLSHSVLFLDSAFLEADNHSDKIWSLRLLIFSGTCSNMILSIGYMLAGLLIGYLMATIKNFILSKPPGRCLS